MRPVLSYAGAILRPYKMSIRRATTADLELVESLLNTARYHYVDIGREDLAALLDKGESVVGELDRVVWGFLGIQSEKRPATLPAGAPSRSYLRLLALRGGYAPHQFAGQLLEEALLPLRQRNKAIQVITYGGEHWLYSSLLESGFTVVDQVQFFELTRPHQFLNGQHVRVNEVVLHSCNAHHLGAIAEMDATAFEPLWHFGRKDMLELFVRARLKMAVIENYIVGYSAVIGNSREELQLARLAVRPDYQGKGIGRLLMQDVVEYAVQDHYERIVLNTQTDNERSQRLYRGFGFRPMGKPVPVMTLSIEPVPSGTAEVVDS